MATAEFLPKPFLLLQFCLLHSTCPRLVAGLLGDCFADWASLLTVVCADWASLLAGLFAD